MGVVKYFNPGILDGSVTTAKLADAAVTSAKIKDLAVVEGKVATNSVGYLRLKADTVRQGVIKTATTSLAGSIPATSFVDLMLTKYAFFPMIHSVQPPDVWVSGHLTDAPDPDLPRLSLNNSGVVARTYDVDYRYIDN